MAYNKTTWAKGDVVTSAKLNNIENGLYSLDYHVEYRVPNPSSTAGKVLMTVGNDATKGADWCNIPDTKEIVQISSEEASQIYALVEQLKTAADSAATKMAATGVPFDGTTFLTNLVDLMLPEKAVPEIKIVSSDVTKNKYLSINDVTAAYASFGYTETSATTLYEVRFFVNTTSIIVRVTSCPFSIVGA